MNYDTPIATDTRAELLNAFAARYDSHLAFDNQPSGTTLSLLGQVRAKRAADGRISAAEPIRLSKTLPILVDPNMLQINRKKGISISHREVFATPSVFSFWGYALLSSNGPVGNFRRTLDAAQSHISTVEHYSRLNSTFNHALRERILEIDIPLRLERNKMSQFNNELPLSGIIYVVVNRGAWPLADECRNSLSTATNDPPRCVKKRKRGVWFSECAPISYLAF